MTRLPGPLGLALSGGGAHGAWQAGAVRALAESGLEFEKVLGFSAGALTGAGYALGLQEVLAHRWRTVDERRVLRFDPRLQPHFALCNAQAIWDAVVETEDEEACKRKLSCELTVVSLRMPQDESEYARFTPGGAKGWDGPLAVKLVASCAIPRIFPRVIHEGQVYMDGGVPGKEWLHFDALAGCSTVVALQMTLPAEFGAPRWFPWTRFEQTGRDICYRQMASGLNSLLCRPDPPTIYRLYPSKRLEMSQLAFRTKYCVPAMELGYQDALRFLKDPQPHRLAASEVQLPVGV
ncbi:MAG: patatin-like phospholipase family protein [Elusimicrobia bacterium]|nr:patatin-like phospholipase family protein [Elusimicrobiota bacterium]